MNSRSHSRCFRPQVEALEDRLALNGALHFQNAIVTISGDTTVAHVSGVLSPHGDLNIQRSDGSFSDGAFLARVVIGSGDSTGTYVVGGAALGGHVRAYAANYDGPLPIVSDVTLQDTIHFDQGVFSVLG